MKKIGFIDYFLSEWHANHYPAWIRENCERTGREYQVQYAYGELEVSPYDGVTTDQWCETYGVQKCSSIQELCEKSDVIFILSPDNPEYHLPYAKEAFPYGKPCYMDKTFAPDGKTAKAIFDLAEQYHVPLFSSSALRFAEELEAFHHAKSVVVSGCGRFDNYLIHFLELVVRLMGSGVKSVMATNFTKNVNLALFYQDGRSACVHMSEAWNGPGFALTIEDKDGTKASYVEIKSAFFENLIDAIMEMFETGKVPIAQTETKKLMAVMDACKIAILNLRQEITVVDPS